MTENNAEGGSSLRIYKAMIWQDAPDSVGIRVSVCAESLDHAKRLLEGDHGEGAAYDLHNPEDAEKPRKGGGRA